MRGLEKYWYHYKERERLFQKNQPKWSHLLKKSLMENFIFCTVQNVYFAKSSNLTEPIIHLHLYNGLWIFTWGKLPSRKFLLVKLHRGKSLLWVLTRIQFFTAVFSTIKHWFGVTVLKTSDDFSKTYVFITIMFPISLFIVKD